MFKKDFQKLEKRFNKHKRNVAETSKNWGKKKFSPNSFTRAQPPPPVEEAAQPWNHVRNDILDDEQAESNSNRWNMNSQEGKNFLKHREQNHRRNVIETSRNASTTWENFDEDETQSDSKPRIRNQSNIHAISKNPESLTTKDRNFVRRRLTRAVMYNSTSLKSAINNMSKNSGLVSKWIPKDTNQPINKNNKFRNN